MGPTPGPGRPVIHATVTRRSTTRAPAAARPPAAACCANRTRQRRDPDEVVGPRERGNGRRQQPAQRQGEQLVAPAVHADGDGESPCPDRDRTDRIGPRRCVRPGEQAAPRLVGGRGHVGDPIRGGERALHPVDDGICRSEEEPEPDGGGGERQHGRRRRAQAADEQQVGDEDQRSQLHRGREPHPDATPPAAPPPREVGEHQGEQDHVDLAEVERRADRVEREHHGHQQRGGRRAERHAHHHRRTPHDEDDQPHVEPCPQDLEDGEREHGQRSEHDGGERRIDERQVEQDATVVEPRAAQHRLAARAVDLQVDHQQVRGGPDHEDDDLGHQQCRGDRESNSALRSPTSSLRCRHALPVPAFH